MAHRCDYSKGCEKPGLYTIPGQDVIPLSIRVCESHRALWVESLQRRTVWPCAIAGCAREAQQDGLCEHCWTVIRAHDDLIRDEEGVTGEVEPALRRLAVRHKARPIVPLMPTSDEVELASKTVETLRTLVRAVAALSGKAPAEYASDLDEASRNLADAARKANLLSRVELVVPVAQQGRLF